MDKQSTEDILSSNEIFLKVCLVLSQMKQRLKQIMQKDDGVQISYRLKQICDRLSGQKDYLQFRTVEMPQLINSVYRKYFENMIVSKAVFILISKTSKTKSIQQAYDIESVLASNLNEIGNDSDTFTYALSAMAGLVYVNQKNQKVFGQKQVMNIILQTGEKNIDDSLLIQKTCSFFSNFSFKNQQTKDVLYENGVITFLMKILKHYAGKDPKSHIPILKQNLRAIGNCSSHPNSIKQIAQCQYLQNVKLIVKQLPSEHFYLVKYSIDILSNLVLSKNKQVLHKLYEGKILQFLYALIEEHNMNTQFVCSCLDTLIGMLMHSMCLTEALQLGFIKLIVKIIQDQEWNKNIVTKCLQCLVAFSEPKESIDQMIELKVPKIISEVLDRSSPDRKIFQKCYGLIRKLVRGSEKCDGVIECIMSAFIYGNTPEQDQIQYLMHMIITMIQSNLMSSIMLQSLFEPVVLNMNKYFKSSQKIAKFGIEILKSVIDEITIEASNMKQFVEFSYKFVTRTNKLFYVSYESLVQNYFCLLARSIIKLPILKIELSNSVFMTILQGWLKIAPLLQIENLKDSVDLLFFILLGTKKFHSQKLDKQQSLIFLKTPTSCLLYRKDKSNKKASINIIESPNNLQNSYLVAYRQNSSKQIKQKYKIKLKDILIITYNFQQNERILQKSVFFQSGGVFSKDSVISNCVTISAVSGDIAKHMNVEFKQRSIKMTFLNHLKNILNLIENII